MRHDDKEASVGGAVSPEISDQRLAVVSNDRFKAYEEHRSQLETARQSSAALFDKYVLAGAGGALVLSISILGRLGPKPACVLVLLSSWCCLACSAGCVLLNFHLTYSANKKAIETADQNIRDNPEEYRLKYSEDKSVLRREAQIECLNVVALVTLAIGVLLLLAFAWINL